MPHGGNAPPTKKQIETLAAIYKLAQQRGAGPTLDELAQELGLAGGSSAQYRIRILERMGWLTYARTRHRFLSSHSLRLTDKGQHMLAQYQWLYTSHILRGEMELVLTGTEFAIAQEIYLPLDTLQIRTEKDKHILVFTAEAERDLWARLLLQAMERRGNR
jgi:SOS-response transcriptional repressor LexA